MEAAARLALKAEEALRAVQTARQSLRVFLLWLLDTMQHHHAKAEGGGAAPVPPPKGGGGGFRHVPKHVRLLLSFLRKAPLPLPPGEGGKPSNAEAIVGVHVAAYFKDGPLPLPTPPKEGPGEEEGGDEDDLAPVSLRTQTQALRAAFEAVFRRPLDSLRGQLGSPRLLRLPPSTDAPPPAFYPSLTPTAPPILCALVSPERAVLLALDPAGTTPAAAVALHPPPGRRWQQAALYGPVSLVPSQNEEALVLVARGVGGARSSSSGRAAAELWKLPLGSLLPALTPLPPPSHGGDNSAFLLSQALALSEIEGAKGRELSQMAPQLLRLAVTGSRGVATVTSRATYLALVDMEEDEEEEEEEEEEDDGDAMEEEEG